MLKDIITLRFSSKWLRFVVLYIKGNQFFFFFGGGQSLLSQNIQSKEFVNVQHINGKENYRSKIMEKC